jgi:hypothetical protein
VGICCDQVNVPGARRMCQEGAGCFPLGVGARFIAPFHTAPRVWAGGVEDEL